MKPGSVKILVTGADGFIGSHLTEKLVEMGFEVCAFVQYNSFNSWGWLDEYSKDKPPNLKIIPGDVRDYHSIKSAMKGCHYVFHLAALIAIPFSYKAPDSYIDTNVKGTLNVLQASLELNIEKVMVTSTSEVYGTAKYVPIDEEHPKQGQSPYSASKIGADFMAESFYRSFELPVVVVRPFNTYGPRQSARAIIPTIITQLLDGKDQIKLGSLHPTRDLVFVDDTVNGFISIALKNNVIGKEINIATQKEVSIGDLANSIISKINPDAEILFDEQRERPQLSEVDRLLGSNELIGKLTGWKPEFDLSTGLDRTIEWFKNKDNMAAYKVDVYNV